MNDNMMSDALIGRAKLTWADAEKALKCEDPCTAPRCGLASVAGCRVTAKVPNGTS